MPNPTRPTAAPPVPDLPVYRDEYTEGPTYERLFGEGPAAVVCRLPELVGVNGAYAIYVVGLRMAPVIEPGDIIFINTSAPPLPGRLVILLPSNCDGVVMIGRLVEETGEEILLQQENPEDEIILDRSDVEAMHVIQYVRKFT
ncbi:MAG: S24 family peptidase [Alphaproteobacteria bacterium]|nr:S24 family peptidase [Alphaproteobacteria bacterium]